MTESTRADDQRLLIRSFESKVASRLKDSSSEVIKRIEQLVDKLEGAILNLSQNQSSVSQIFHYHEQDDEISTKVQMKLMMRCFKMLKMKLARESRSWQN